MTIAGRKEGPRAPLFCVAAATALLLPAPAHSQSVDRSVLQRCAALPETELKLACFEALAAPDDPAEAGAAPAESVPERVTDAERALAADQTRAVPLVTATIIAASPEDARPPPEPGPEAQPEGLVEATAIPPSAPVVGATAANSVADELGAKYLQHEKTDAAEEPERIIAKVDKVTVGYGRRLFFHFENGQVWRQATAGYLQYPRDEAFDVEISRGMMGDYRLRIGGEGRMSRIVRVE